MEIPQKIELPTDTYNQDSITLSQINLFFGTNGTGKSYALKIIMNKNPASLFVDENRLFIPSVVVNFPNPRKDPGHLVHYHNLVVDEVLVDINVIFQKLFPDRKLIKDGPIGSTTHQIAIQKNGKNYAIGADGRGMWNVIKPIEALSLSGKDSPVLIEEFSLGLFPGFLDKYYNLIKEKILEKGCLFVCTTQDPFVVYQFIKNKINDKMEWDDQEPSVSLFKFLENKNGKIDIIKIDGTIETKALLELLGGYTEGMDMINFYNLFSNDNDRISI